VAALLLLGAAGCAFNPVTGRPAIVLTTTGQERAVGKEEAAKVEAAIGLIDDGKLAQYVDTVGQRLVQQFSSGGVQYTFAIVDMVEPNAFALPGGYVYVSRGLLALVNSEDELANVIGHEIGHVAARHSSRQLTLAAPFAIATGLGSMATSIVSPALGNVVAGVGGLTSQLLLAPYSRQQEREADDLGMQLAARAGWDPSAMSTFLHTLEREEALRQGEVRQYSFLASHPTTPERVRTTASNAATYDRGDKSPIAADRQSMLQRLDGLLVGPDPAAGVFVGDRFLHPVLDFSLHLPEEWSRQNAREAVSAVAPDGDAAFLLTTATDADDAVEVARNVAEKLGADPDADVKPLRIGGRRAAYLEAEARSAEGRFALALTWIEHAGQVYQLMGMSTPQRFATYAEPFQDMARSFRPLSAAERGSIRESRLRIVRARDSEAVDALVQRAGASWTAAETAVANALQVDQSLRAGELVKVPVLQRYVPAPRGS
jgi:predicted Zn-dependent protease